MHTNTLSVSATRVNEEVTFKELKKKNLVIHKFTAGFL